MSARKVLFLAPAQAVTRIFAALKDLDVEVGIAENMRGASAFIRQSSPALIITRPSLPGYKAEDLLAVGADDPAFPPVIIAAERGTVQDAEHYLSLGAKDYWLDPLNPEKIAAVMPAPGKSVPLPPNTTLGGHKPDMAGARIIGQDPAIGRVLALARQVAPSKATVLIAGESGTGKEVFARYVHNMSGRGGRPFVAVNCAALPEHLLESELFGHEKGAFTGAINRKLGKFELAHGGTILLDEISEMELSLQAKLLRVLQESELDRVGGSETVKVDVRVIATTNRDLAAWVEEGKFRQDLYFRLNVIPLTLPPLRERGADVELLARFFMDMYSKDYGIANVTLSPAALDWLKTYNWPGNVRELQNLMERAVLLCGGRPIEPGHFLLDPDNWPVFLDSAPESAAASGDSGQGAEAAPAAPANIAASAPEAALPPGDAAQAASGAGAPANAELFSSGVIPLHEMERLMIMRGLEQTAGNRTQAADLLGISVRTLRNKLNEYRELGVEVF